MAQRFEGRLSEVFLEVKLRLLIWFACLQLALAIAVLAEIYLMLSRIGHWKP